MDEAQRQSMMENQINETANLMADQYLAEQTNSSEDNSSSGGSSPCSVSKDQAYLVYKFLNTPNDLLIAGMTQMQPQQLIQFYRKLAIQLHPDKNHHPKATDAFQVVQSAMESAKATVRANNPGAF